MNGQQQQTLTLTEFRQTWSFPVDLPSDTRIIPSLNRGFTAPVEIEYPYDDTALATLSNVDTDPFNRWDALQKLLLRTLMARIKTAVAQEGSAEDTLPNGLSNAFGQILLESDHDPMFVAECITLPSE
jgi:aminopeptidase N